MLTLQTILLIFSLLLMLGMVTSLMCLARLRVRSEHHGAAVEGVDGHLVVSPGRSVLIGRAKTDQRKDAGSPIT
jgi:hypothetical protein